MTENRTWLVSVLFLDIVGYSKVPVDQQMTTKRHFNTLVARATEAVESDQCIELDTGDGCAICYFGDPEKIYPVAIGLRDTFDALQTGDPVYYQVRLGLNLGPVKMLEDIKGERNCVGAGINDAQRVMDFADANQLLVSKSYFDIVSEMSSHYTEQLSYLGTRSDKHDKAHEIYELTGRRATASQPVTSQKSGFSIEHSISEKLTSEYAKYVGKSEAQRLVSLHLQTSSTLADLCRALGDTLSEDDRYHFNEFLSYYGYGKY